MLCRGRRRVHSDPLARLHKLSCEGEGRHRFFEEARELGSNPPAHSGGWMVKTVSGFVNTPRGGRMRPGM